MRESLLIWKKKKRKIKRIFLINKKKNQVLVNEGKEQKNSEER